MFFGFDSVELNLAQKDITRSLGKKIVERMLKARISLRSRTRLKVEIAQAGDFFESEKQSQVDLEHKRHIGRRIKDR